MKIRRRKNPNSKAQEIIDGLKNPNYYTLQPLLKSEALTKYIIKNLLNSKIYEIKVDEFFQDYDPSVEWNVKPFWTLYFLEILFDTPDNYRMNKVEKKYFLIGGAYSKENSNIKLRKFNKFETYNLSPNFHEPAGYTYILDVEIFRSIFWFKSKFTGFLKDAVQHYKLGKEYTDILAKNLEKNMIRFNEQTYGIFRL